MVEVAAIVRVGVIEQVGGARESHCVKRRRSDFESGGSSASALSSGSLMSGGSL